MDHDHFGAPGHGCTATSPCIDDDDDAVLSTTTSAHTDSDLDESHGHASSLPGVEPTGYGLGRSGWLNVPVDSDGATVELLRDWIEESWPFRTITYDVR